MDLFCDGLVGERVLFDFVYHYFIDEVQFPELLIVAQTFIVFWRR